MLENVSHLSLKEFVKLNGLDWQHIFSFGRILSRSIRKKENILINSEIFFTKKWYAALLISLFLNEKNSIFIISDDQIQELKNLYLKQLKDFGFNFSLKNNKIIFLNHQICLMTLSDLVENNLSSNELKNNTIIFTKVEDIKKNLQHELRILLYKKDWFLSNNNYLDQTNEIGSTYNFLKKKLFLKSIPSKTYVYLDQEELNLLRRIFSNHSSFSSKFAKINNALNAGWVFWAILDQDNFEWILNIEPINELNCLKDLFMQNHSVFLSRQRDNVFLQRYLKGFDINLNLTINFKGDFAEQNIQIYIPKSQMLPNNPSFSDNVIVKCNSWILLRKGLIVILSNDKNLKIKLATSLASKHGYEVILENIPYSENQILCASFDWWIKHLHLCKIPDQIIIPLLPIPSMSEPKINLTVLHETQNSKDWFRNYLYPETYQKLDQAIAPLRRNSGKLIVFDGRVNNRKWGRELIQLIQPSVLITNMIPFC